MTGPLFMPEIGKALPGGEQGERILKLRESGLPIPGIWHLFAWRSGRTDHLARYTQGVMRGPSPLPPWQRELIAALTSRKNNCDY